MASKLLRSLVLLVAVLGGSPAIAQPLVTVTQPQPDTLLSGRDYGMFDAGGMRGLDFARFNSNSRDRWFPLRSYDGGRTWTRDPGAFSGRRDRAHDARVRTAREYRLHQDIADTRGPLLVLGRGELNGAAGLNAGAFRDGRYTFAHGRAGAMHLDVLRAEGGLNGEAGFNEDGLALEGHAGGRAVLVGVTGETNRLNLGGRGLGADAAANGRANVGAEAQGDADLTLGRNGLRARLGGEAFAGARASGELPLGVSLLGIRFGATPRGHLSAGAGLNGNAYAGVGNGGVRAGCELGGCLGLGAGAGLDVEIDATGLIDFFSNLGGSGGGFRPAEDYRPRVVGQCGPGMYQVSTVNCIGSRTTQIWSEESVRRLRAQDRDDFQNLSAFFQPPRHVSGTGTAPGSGNNTGRFTNTLTNAERDALINFLREGQPSNAGTRR